MEDIMSKKITVIITMAGLGKRFRDAGYDRPKYMIEVKGKSLFEWAMDSLIGYNMNTFKYIFVVQKSDSSAKFITEKFSQYGIENYEILEIDHLTDGQATTGLFAIEHCGDDEPILFYNIDTYVEPFELKYDDIKGDGYIPCFYVEGTHWSFVKADENNKAVEVKEKNRISDNCTLGAYYFSSAGLYKELYNEFYINNNSKLPITEKYIAPLYNYMIKKGLSVFISIVNSDKVHVLGTPEELKAFMEL